MLNKAIEIAARAHAGQVDKAEAPYILHRLRETAKARIEKYRKAAERIAEVLANVKSNSLKLGTENCIDEGQDYTLFVILLSKIPNRHLTESLIRDHVQFLRRLDRDNKLVLCGPFSDYEGGMIVIRASTLEEANSIAMSDPFVAHEVENYEIRTWQLSCEANNHMGMG